MRLSWVDRLSYGLGVAGWSVLDWILCHRYVGAGSQDTKKLRCQLGVRGSKQRRNTVLGGDVSDVTHSQQRRMENGVTMAG